MAPSAWRVASAKIIGPPKSEIVPPGTARATGVDAAGIKQVRPVGERDLHRAAVLPAGGRDRRTVVPTISSVAAALTEPPAPWLELTSIWLPCDNVMSAACSETAPPACAPLAFVTPDCEISPPVLICTDPPWLPSVSAEASKVPGLSIVPASLVSQMWPP